MGVFDRMANLWNGFWGIFISDIEKRNPEAVYESAINERIKKHRELKKAVSGIVYLRNKLAGEKEDKEKQLKEISFQLPVAIEEEEDDVAVILIQKKDELTTAIEGLTAELMKVSDQAEESKAGLITFRAEIDKLRREKDQMLAKKANAEARIKINETLDGLSTDADIKALENVREGIEKLNAEADIGSEIQDSGLDSKLRKIKEKAKDASAKAQLVEMKKQMAAKKSATEGAAGGSKKTI